MSDTEPAVLRLLVEFQADAPANSTLDFALVLSPAGPAFPTTANATYSDKVPDLFNAPDAGPGVRWQQFQLIIENPVDTAFFVGLHNPGLELVSVAIVAHYSHDRVLRIGSPEVAVAVRSTDAVVFFKILKEDLGSAFRSGSKGFILFSAYTPDHVDSYLRRDKFASVYVHDMEGTLRPDTVKGGNYAEILIPNLGSDTDLRMHFSFEHHPPP